MLAYGCEWGFWARSKSDRSFSWSVHAIYWVSFVVFIVFIKASGVYTFFGALVCIAVDEIIVLLVDIFHRACFIGTLIYLSNTYVLYLDVLTIVFVHINFIFIMYLAFPFYSNIAIVHVVRAPVAVFKYVLTANDVEVVGTAGGILWWMSISLVDNNAVCIDIEYAMVNMVYKASI